MYTNSQTDNSIKENESSIKNIIETNLNLNDLRNTFSGSSEIYNKCIFYLNYQYYIADLKLLIFY